MILKFRFLVPLIKGLGNLWYGFGESFRTTEKRIEDAKEAEKKEKERMKRPWGPWIGINRACLICLEDFEEEGQLCALLHPCRHAFHPACIDPWFDKAGITCPVCKSSSPTFKGTLNRFFCPMQQDSKHA